jgi:predicted permease
MGQLIGDFVQDVRCGARSLLRTKAFTSAVALTLMIGIGGIAAVFSAADAVLFKPLGYRQPEQLYAVHEVLPATGRAMPQVPVNALHFEEWRRSTRSFEEMALIAPTHVTVTWSGRGEPQRMGAARVSPNVFNVLGLRPQLGRFFAADEDRPGADSVVVISDDVWRGHLGGDPDVLGRTIDLDGAPHVVIGILEAGVPFPRTSALYQMSFAIDPAQIWKPFAARPAERTPTAFQNAAIVRLKTGASASGALEDLNAVQTQLAQGLPSNTHLSAELVPLKDQLTGRSRAWLELLLVSAALVLIASCINVANLFVARGTSRRRELGIRQATGATRGRLTRQLVAEGLLLASCGGLLGVAFAYVSIRLIVIAAPVGLPRIEQVALDARVFGFAALVSIVIGLLVGLIPAWRLTRTPASEALKSGAGILSGGTGRGARGRLLLVGVEVAAATVCVVVAGLLVSSFVTLLRVDRGFETERVIGATFSLPRTRYDTAEASRFLEAIRDGAQAIPGIASVGLSDRLPLSGEAGNRPLAIEGSTLKEFQRPVASLHLADASFFRTFSIPLVAGRLFEDADRRREAVAVVSTTAAERLWPSQNPVGKRFRLADDAPLTEVVGVVGHVHGVSLESTPRLDVYLPYWFTYIGQVSVSVRTTGAPTHVMPLLRGLARQFDPQLAVPAFQTMDEVLADSVAPRRFQMTLVLLFAATALLLAIIGIYGTTSYIAAMRTPEIAIRLAVGARDGHIRWLMLHQGLKPVAVGVAGGLMVSLLLGGALRGVLFGTTHTDPTTLTAAAAILVSVGAIATYMPTRRVLRGNPLAALRQG